jgi:hypothetical protein
MRSCLLAVSVTLVLSVVPARAETAAEVATAFCVTRTSVDEARLKPLLTPSLLAVIAEAEERNHIIAEATPDEKPPFGDGIPYQSFPDRPDTCEPGKPAERAGRTEIAVTYGFAKTPRANWTDTLILVSAEGQALIDDIRFRESADGSGALTLREILHDAFDQ